MEAESEAGVLAGVAKALEVFEPDAPPPSRIHRTQWWSGRHTRGAYSFVRSGESDTAVRHTESCERSKRSLAS